MTVSQRHTSRQRIPYADPHVSDSLRDFRDSTDGVSGRLDLRGCEAMRLGRTPSPQQHFVRLLDAGRRAKLGRAWALERVAWLQSVVNRLFPTEATPRSTLRSRVAAAAAAREAVELEALIAQEPRELLLREQELLRAEIAAECLLLAAIGQALEEHRSPESR